MSLLKFLLVFCSQDERFHKLIVDTVLEGIAREFKIQLKMSGKSACNTCHTAIAISSSMTTISSTVWRDPFHKKLCVENIHIHCH